MTAFIDLPQVSMPLSRLGHGAAAISGEGGGYGFGQISEAQSIELLLYAFSRGINVFDTAPIYGFGSSEIRIGKAFQNIREKVFLVSKSGIDWPENKRVNLTNDPAVAARMLDETLARLQTDYIDLYMVHWPDPKVDIRLTLAPLIKAREQGKILHLGLCNTHLEDLHKALSVTELLMAQSEYNFFKRDNEKLFPILAQNGMGFMSWGSLLKGILSGTVNRQRKFDDADARSWAPWWKAMDKEAMYKSMENVSPLLEEHGHSKLELALGFLAKQKAVTTILVGMRTPAQVDSALAAFDHLPSEDLLRKLQGASS